MAQVLAREPGDQCAHCGSQMTRGEHSEAYGEAEDTPWMRESIRSSGEYESIANESFSISGESPFLLRPGGEAASEAESWETAGEGETSSELESFGSPEDHHGSLIAREAGRQDHQEAEPAAELANLTADEIATIFGRKSSLVALHWLLASNELQRAALAALLGNAGRRSVRVLDSNLRIPTYLRLVSRLCREAAEQTEQEAAQTEHETPDEVAADRTVPELQYQVLTQSPGPVVAPRSVPIPGWNFTPSDFQALRAARKDLTIAQDSTGWFPSKLQENLLNTLRFLLGPHVSPRGTEGVNVLDLFHGHLVVDKKDLLVDWEGKERPPEEAITHSQEFEKQEKLAAANTLGGSVTGTKWGPKLNLGYPKYPMTAKNLPGFTTAIEKLLPAFGNVLDEGANVPGAAVMYHTFELTTPSDLAAKGQKLNADNPRRHYVTPLDTNTPRQYTPPPLPESYEKEYIIIAPFCFLVDDNGAVHVRPMEAAGSGFTSLELSTITGTPFPGEPFPIP
jgi:hypothetical protein